MKRFALASRLERFLFCAVVGFALGCSCWPRCSAAATIVVTNGASSGVGTLATALSNARNGDVITFAVTGFITNRTTGGLTIRSNISIVGPGSNILTITGTNWFSAFQVNNGATSSISGVTFYRCTSAINNSANLTVSNCVFTGCYKGGGIGNFGNLTIIGCTFTDCRGSYGFSWADFPEVFTPGAAGNSGNNGGAIVNSGTMTALNCQFLNNFAGFGGDGASGQVTRYSIFQNSRSTTGGNGGNGGSGGAVYDTGTASFTNCTFGWNTSGAGGNGGPGGYGSMGQLSSDPYFVYPGQGFRGGNAGSAGNGGAVWSSGGIKFVGCTFFGNATGAGGNGGNGGNGYTGLPFHDQNPYPGGNGGNAGNAGNGTLYCPGSCQIAACTFYGNQSGVGGNGGNGGSGVNNTFIPGGNGGNAGNAGNGGSGGAIFGSTTNVSFTLQNTLIAMNTSTVAGSAGAGGGGGSGTFNPSYGISGFSGTNAIDGTGPDLSGKFTSRSHNFISLGDGSKGLTNNVKSDIVGSGSPLDAMLGALADNHGPVPTCALLAGSPALDAGDDTLLASNILKDARGYARKAGAHVDIGAYEFQAPSAQFSCRSTATENGVVVTITNTPGALFTLLSTTDITLPVEYWDVLGPMTETMPGLFQWTDTDSFNYEFRFFSVRSP